MATTRCGRKSSRRAVRSIALARIGARSFRTSAASISRRSSRPQQRRFQGAIRSILLPSALSDRLIAAAKAQGVTPFSVAAAGLAMALQPAAGQTKVAMGTQMSVRDQQELEGVVGPLINTVILRLDVPPNSTLASVTAQCGAKLSDAIEHLHLPFEEMMTMAGEVSDVDRPPLCSVNFALQQSFVGLGDEVRRGDFAATTSPSFNAGALYDLSFFMVRRPEGWRISCEGDTDLYDVETVDGYLASGATCWKQSKLKRNSRWRPLPEKTR